MDLLAVATIGRLDAEIKHVLKYQQVVRESYLVQSVKLLTQNYEEVIQREDPACTIIESFEENKIEFKLVREAH